MVGGLAGRSGQESLELGKCRGLLQGLLSGLTLAPALEMQAGMTGQAWATPSPSSPGPPNPSFQSFRQGILGGCGPHSASLGTSEASARQMGHVRLAWGSSHTSGSTLACPPPQLGLLFWDLTPEHSLNFSMTTGEGLQAPPPSLTT